MLEWFSRRDQRWIKMIEVLANQRQSTLKSLSEQTSIPSRTLWEDIQGINVLISPIEIVTAQDGIVLDIPVRYSERFLYQKILESSNEINLLELIFRMPTLNLNELSQRLYVSENTIRRMVKQLNLHLKHRKMKIETHPYRITGDRHAIRATYIALFTEKYHRIQNFASSYQVEAIYSLIKNSREIKAQLDNQQDLNRLALWLYVRLMVYMQNPEADSQPIMITLEHEDKVSHQFEIAFSTPLTIEIKAVLFEFIMSGKVAMTYTQALIQSKNSPKEIKLFQAIDLFLTRFIEQHGLHFRDYDVLMVQLFNLTRLTHYQPYIIYPRDQHFVNHIKRYEPYLMESIETLYSECFNDLLDHQFRDSILYHLLTHWEGIITLVHHQQEPIHMALYFDSDIEHARMIQKIIQEEYSHRFEFEIIDTLEEDKALISIRKSDILITNIPALQISDVRILCIDEFMFKQDWNVIRLFIEAIEKERA